MTVNQFRLHRFSNLVAFSFEGHDDAENQTGTETLYISADMADLLADHLREYAADVRAVSFIASHLGTTIEYSE